MMDFTKIENLLKGFITEKTTPEDAEKIAEINAELGKIKTETTDFAVKHEELRQKYVNAVMNSTFKEAPEEAKEEPKFKSLDEIAADYEKQQKGK